LSGLLALPAIYTSILLLAFRLAAGAGWLQHGILKVRGGAWNQAGQWIQSMGVPAFVAPLVTLLEVGGGIFLIVGLIVPIVGFLFFLEMLSLVLMKKYKMKSSFLPKQQGQSSYELDFLYMLIALALIAVGSGRYHSTRC
jgi:uncharacterized membrane protein YphA (DoxX/SURF4 family)